VGAAAEPRFAMLETIGEFAAERLRESGEAEGARRRHARHFLALAEAVPPEVWAPTAYHDARLDRLGWEHENVPRALGWLAGNPNVVLGLRWGAALGWFWWWRAYGRDDGAAEGQGESGGRPGQGAPAIRAASLASADRGARLARARATFGAAYAAWRAGDDATADALFEESRAAWIDARGGDEAEVAHSQWGLELVVRWERLDALALSAYEE